MGSHGPLACKTSPLHQRSPQHQTLHGPGCRGKGPPTAPQGECEPAKCLAGTAKGGAYRIQALESVLVSMTQRNVGDLNAHFTLLRWSHSHITEL
eukprot:scaffold1672_cov366-Prasinococcus_capsulatus_cf.AAC.12